MKLSAELLSPAGNSAALRAAVVNGADAVYLALDKFGARAKAENFTAETLPSAVRYAHIMGVKVYVAVNTLLTDDELPQALSLIDKAWEIGVDAFIVQDLGLIRKIRSTMPDVVLHASTQMGIHNVSGARFIEELGIRRVVLSREANLADIEAIHNATDLEIEFFVHGALCIAFSGNCLISSFVSGYSGNRGRCMQLCRKKYDVVCDGVKKSGYYLSPKDICMLDRLSDLCAAGVTSFKIEGRMRSPEYVAETTRIYRKALDGQPITETDRDALKAVFNRGDYCAGYLDGNTVIYPKMQGHKGIYRGKVLNVRNGKALLSCGTELDVGDGVKFIRNAQEVGSALINGNPTTFVGSVRQFDEVYQTTSAVLAEDVRRRQKRVPIEAVMSIHAGQPIALTLTCRNTSVSVSGATAESAVSAAITDNDATAAIAKTGDSEYYIASFRIDNDDKSFVPKSGLNALRRQAIALLDEQLSQREAVPESNVCHVRHNNCTMSDKTTNSYGDSIYIIDSQTQLHTLQPFLHDSYVIVSPKSYASRETEQLVACLGERAVLELPIIANQADLRELRKIVDGINPRHICIQNVYGFELAENRGVLLGCGMNVLNRETGSGYPYIQSPEAPHIISPDAYVYTFGFLPLMTCKHCPRQTVFGCDKCRGDYAYSLQDERGKFFVRHYKVSACYAQICADKPIQLTEELDKVGHTKRIYDFRGCDEEMIRTVLSGGTVPHNHFNFNKKLV